MAVVVFIVFKTILIFAAVGVAMTYVVDPCYIERDDVHTEQDMDLLSVNVTLYAQGEDGNVSKVQQVDNIYFVDHGCELDLYLNTDGVVAPPGYLFVDDIRIECEFDEPDVKTVLPENTILRYANRWLSYPRHRLPAYFNDNVVHMHFSHVAAEGPVYGTCHLRLAFIGSTFTFGNITYAIEVKGCPVYKYGLQCNEVCECSDGVKCHNFNGECLCPLGLTGEICDQRDPVVEVASPYEYPKWSSDVEIYCRIHGLQNAFIGWTKDGIDLPKVNRELDVQYQPRPIQSALLLYNVTSMDNGVYVCTANANGISIQKIVTITVIDIPNPFLVVLSKQTVKSGETVTLTCRVKPAAGAIAWVKGRQIPNSNTTLTTTGNVHIVNNITMGLSQLKITNATLQDENVYRCYVGHIIDGDTINFSESEVVVYIDPLEPYPRLSGYQDQDVHEVNVDDVIDLKCETELSKPAVEMSWFLDEVLVASIDKEVTMETLTASEGLLFNVSSSFSKTATVNDNSKEVVCVASNPSFGKRNSSIMLNVTYMPIVNVYPESIKVEAGDDVFITCNASANPEPVSYRWTVTLADDSTFSFTNETLELDDVTTDFDNAVVTCWATNVLGTSSASVSSFVVVGPGPRLEIIIPTAASCAVLLVFILYLITYKYRHVLQTIMAKNVFKLKKEQEKEYDCYISYKKNGEDEDFVVGSLVPWLEQKGCKVCVDYKCFLPGEAIKDNITNYISKSRTVIVVLSPSFLKCRWCNYELKTAYTNFHEGHSNILPIIYEDVQEEAKTNFVIKTLFNSITYLSWPNTEVDGNHRAGRRFWRDFENALGLKKDVKNIPNPIDGDINMFNII